MSLERLPSRLAGVRYGAVTRFSDERGTFREVWRASRQRPSSEDHAGSPEAPFVQANLSTSAAGVLRGLHCHRRQIDYWVVAAGRAFVAVVDVRPVVAGETTANPAEVGGRAGPSPESSVVSNAQLPRNRSGRAIVETRELVADDWVMIPPGVAHGFLALEPLELLYLVTNEYDGSDELGFAWDDPAVSVPWPVLQVTPDGRPILSKRDQTNPSLAELVRRLLAADAIG